MLKFSVYNSIVDEVFNDVCFTTEEATISGQKRNLNLIFASNASGKSTLSTIIESYFNKNPYPVNKFTNNPSSMTLIENDENFDKVYKYDRMFASKSADIYKGELIVSPKNADEIVKIKEKIDENLKKLIDTYKTLESYSILKEYNDLLKGTQIAKLASKRFVSGSDKEIYDILNIDLPKDENCNNYSIEYLLDLMLYDTSFLELCININEDAIKLIKDSFPEIDNNDAHFYNEILDYMSNHSNKILNNVCLMCGKTIITPEIIDERIMYIKQQINNYQLNISNNEIFGQLLVFEQNKYNSQIFQKFQKNLSGKKKEQLVSELINIGNEVTKSNMLNVKKVSTSCIVKKIINEKNMQTHVNVLKTLFNDLLESQKKNSSILDESVKQRFSDNLVEMQFKYANSINVILKSDNTISITCKDIDIENLYENILSESEKSVLSFALFLSIIKDYDKSIIIIDDPIDSHDQKNKWFILDKIGEYFLSNNAMVIILTHDLDVSKSLNLVYEDINFSNFLLTKKNIQKIDGTSLYFRDISNFIFDVKTVIESNSVTDNEKYIIPLGFLLRYLCRNQYKHLNEITSSSIPIGFITRKMTKEIGFEDISNSFVHYKKNTDSQTLLNNLFVILKINRKSTKVPSYICNCIDSDKLIEDIINDINPICQFENDIVKIMKVLLIRNTIEKKMKIKMPSISEKQLGKIAGQYEGKFGTNDKLYIFYKKNKFMVDEFAHLESGVDALLTYDIDYIEDELKALYSIV